MRTAVVTGATGFIGRALTKKLTASGIRVYAIGRSAEKLAELSQISGVMPIAAEFEEYRKLAEQVPERPDAFYHCAFEGGFGTEELRDYGLQLRNARYSCDAVSSAIEMGVTKFVLASTVNTVELRSFIANEAFEPRYTCIYSTGKLAAELIGRTLAYNRGMEFNTALIAMPYGEGNRARTLPNIVIEQLLEHIPPKLIEGNNLYDLVYIDDIVAALLMIGEHGKNFRDYYIGHRRLDTFRSWMIRIRDTLSPQTGLGFGQYPDAPSLDYNMIDLEALYRDTGFECRSDFETSIRKTAAWLIQQKENTKMKKYEDNKCKIMEGGVKVEQYCIQFPLLYGICKSLFSTSDILSVRGGRCG